MTRNKRIWVVSVGLGLLVSLVTSATYAEESINPLPWLDNDIYKVSIDMRGRIELADMNRLQNSEAYTVRTRVGLGFKPWHGFSGFAELENTTSADSSRYFDAASTPNGKTPIADPQNTELNQAFGQYQNADWADLVVKGGRQRIILDDARFIGNVSLVTRGRRPERRTSPPSLTSCGLATPESRTSTSPLSRTSWTSDRTRPSTPPTPTDFE